jgi:Lrp/AsnC family transcriptional regulator for asnA, asnC and gidA
MKLAGIITRTVIELNAKKLGYDVCCFIGINLRSAKDYSPALIQLENIE